MAIINDISSWAGSLHSYSIELITYGDIFQFDQNNNRILHSSNADEIRSSWINEKNPVMHVFWLSFSTGIECLCKTVLIKHECLRIRKKNILDKYPIKKRFSSREEAQEYRNDTYGGVYRTASRKVVARNNKWLEKQLQENDINYITEINTPTLGYIYNNSFKKLFNLEVIDEDELNKLEKGIETLTDIRRNVDAHIFLTRRVVGSIQNDIEEVYLPTTNLLLNIYQRSP